MEEFSNYFLRLVTSNAAVIFSSNAKGAPSSRNYEILINEMRKVTEDINQASRIVQSILSGTDELFLKFDLAVFVDHFDIDLISQTALVLAFKVAPRSDLVAQADAFLDANEFEFINALSRPPIDLNQLEYDTCFLSFTIDRYIQYRSRTVDVNLEMKMRENIYKRYSGEGKPPPAEILAALNLYRLLSDKPTNSLCRHIKNIGSKFTRSIEECLTYLKTKPQAITLDEESVSTALTYVVISQSPTFDPCVLTASLSSVLPLSFSWGAVLSFFDQPNSRISSSQINRLYNALALSGPGPSKMDLRMLWSGQWEHTEAQLSYLCAFSTLEPKLLEATGISEVQNGIDEQIYIQAVMHVRERAAMAMQHPISCLAVTSVIFHLILRSNPASMTTETQRLFHQVIIPNADIFVVVAFEISPNFGEIAFSTIASLIERILATSSPHIDFLLFTLFTRHATRFGSVLFELYTAGRVNTFVILESAITTGLITEIVYMPNIVGCELALIAHCKKLLDISDWAKKSEERGNDVNGLVSQLLTFRAGDELELQRHKEARARQLVPLTVNMVSILLQILEDSLPKSPVQQLMDIQRQCIGAYPRLVNYGEGYDDIIDVNGLEGNALRPDANAKMEEHYRKMYNNEIQVRDVVELLDMYKRSHSSLDQDIFACMIHGLLDEYGHYGGYPVEALATTAVLFGGILARRLVPDLPLKVGLGMILEAVKDHHRDHPMFKFGLQALVHLLGRFPEWPGFCTQLLQIPSLIGTEPWNKAREIVRLHEESQNRCPRPAVRHTISTIDGSNDIIATEIDVTALTRDTVTRTDLSSHVDLTLTNSDEHNVRDGRITDRSAPFFTFMTINSDPSPTVDFKDPDTDIEGRIHFVLNNLTDGTLHGICVEIRALLSISHYRWFASHLVDKRAKMQPNYHHVYIELIRAIDSTILWGQVLQATYMTIKRSLNSEIVMNNSVERSQLRNLGQWLGLLTLGRDKPIKHGNIAFRQLLVEAFDGKRLIVVIPFVCRVLVQAVSSSIFRPPNPWLMDLIYLLVELYHQADLKLNLKFEIEVLCKELGLDVRGIQPSHELANRPFGDAHLGAGSNSDGHLEGFDGLALGLVTAPLTAPSSLTIPDVSGMVHVPPINEMVITASRLGEIVRKGFDYAIREIISAVVERSVTIAAIATTNMIRKDFATEGDENRVRECAIKMAKATAGSLALVTSKDPMRAHLTNYIRNMSTELPQGLPEGTITMCVTSNLDLGCSVIERAAEERAVPEIENILRSDLEARRHHRAAFPNEIYVDSGLSRWAMAMPYPFKLSPGIGSLNREQMAIYEEFARQPRTPGTTSGAVSHIIPSSDASRPMTNDLQDQFNISTGFSVAPSTENSIASSQPQAQAQTQTHAQVRAHAEAHAQVRAHVEAQSRAHAEAQARAHARAHIEARAHAESQVQARAHVGVQALTHVEAQPSLSALQLLQQPSQQQSSQIPAQPDHPMPQTTTQHLAVPLITNFGPPAPNHTTTYNSVPRGATLQHDQQWQGAFHRAQKLVQELQRVASEANEDHFHGLPRPHPVLDIVDALVQLIIKTSQTAEEFTSLIADHICQVLFSRIDDNLTLESLVHVLETLQRIGLRSLESRVAMFFHQQPTDQFFRPQLIAAFSRTNLIDWRVVDCSLANAISKRDPGALACLDSLLDLLIWGDMPILFSSDMARTLEATWLYLCADSTISNDTLHDLRKKLLPPSIADLTAPLGYPEREITQYIFDEWVARHRNPNATEQGAIAFIDQLQATGIFCDTKTLFLFIRIAANICIDKFEQSSVCLAEALIPADALAHLLGLILRSNKNKSWGDSLQFADSVMSLLSLMLAHDYAASFDTLRQKIYYRLLSGFLEETVAFCESPDNITGYELMCQIAIRLGAIGPTHLPGFAHSWLQLLQHGTFILSLARHSNKKGWSALTYLLCQQLEFLGKLLKPSSVSIAAKVFYRGTLKLLFVLQHDFPDFIAAAYIPLCATIPPHCTQLLGTVLSSTISDGNPTTTLSSASCYQSVPLDFSITVISNYGLLELVDSIIKSGYTEGTAERLIQAFCLDDRGTELGRKPIGVNVKLIGAFVVYACYHALKSRGADLASNGPEASAIRVLVQDLPISARFYMLWWIINHLRSPGPVTGFFHNVLLDIFAFHIHDPVTHDIRETITRIILERLVGYWPHPWGLVVTVVELIKNERYLFFDLPFIKSTPDIIERFAGLAQS